MKKEYTISDSKFVFSKNELGYQEVIDEMPSAKEITIITYNISDKQDYLINCLKNTSDDCEINIITNIPTRWEYYYADSYRERARQKINFYMSKLDPQKFGNNVEVLFNFSNHGKIIMTDKIVYIGSENFSEESERNTEFGIISKDVNFIGYLKNVIFEDVKSDSATYYEYNYTSLLFEATMIISAIFNAKNCLYEEIYFLHDDIDGEWYYYNDTEATLSPRTLDNVKNIIETSCKIASDIYDAIDNVTDSDEDITSQANDMYERLNDISNKIEELITSDNIYDLSIFTTENFIDSQLQTEYAMEAYEENLDHCIELASSTALGELSDLAQSAREDLDQLLTNIDEFKSLYSEFIEFFKKYHKKINPIIDNATYI